MPVSQRADGPPPAARSLGHHAAQIRLDAAALVAELRATTVDLEREISDRARRRPFGTLTAAAAVGYVLGGGLRSQLTVVLLGAATRLAASYAVRELGDFSVRMDSQAPRPIESNDATGA